MRAKAVTVARALASVARALWRTLSSEIGRDEIMLAIALTLVAGGLWQFWRPGALLVPGAVILWIYLPQRVSFIHRQDAPRRRGAD